jgi:hypothetical protein
LKRPIGSGWELVIFWMVSVVVGASNGSLRAISS